MSGDDALSASDDAGILASITTVLRSEADALAALAALAGSQAAALTGTCRLIRERCTGAPGRLVVSGIGKAGLIARKVAATFASTGTPALFLHPAEARHGDLGVVQEHDVALVFSHSGASEEVVALLPSLKRIGVALIAVVGRTDSPLARHSEHVLSIGAITEACPLGLAPSTSTTAMLALGDALALTVQRLRAFTPEQYALFHPGGALGRKLMTCAEAMRAGDRVAVVSERTPVHAAMDAITRARAGSALLVDDDGRLLGIFTDGDLRRAIARTHDLAALLAAPVRTHATAPCLSVIAGDLLQTALHLCAQRKIGELPVLDGERRPLGMLDLKDLVQRGFEV